MKNLMRFAMVLALAGSALLYSGCTKDYQKDIDDLNTGVTTLQGTVQKLQEQVSALEALKSQVASLQGDVAPLQAAIDKNTEAIAKLQDVYVTKDELDAELTSIREETLDALAGVAIVVADNTEAIAALKEAFKKTDAVAEALNLGKIASVAFVPAFSSGTSAPAGYVDLKAWELVDNATSPNMLYKTSALLNLDYQVSPASLAGTLGSDNVTLSIYSPNKKAYVSVPVTVTDADAETGLVSLYVDLFSKSLAKYFDNTTAGLDATDEAYLPFALEISSTSEEGVVNEIKSQYEYAHVEPVTATQLKYSADFDNIEVPFDKFASSERKFFDGLEFELTYTAGSVDYYMSLNEAAGIFGVDVAVITPVFKSKLTKSSTFDSGSVAGKKGADYISYDLSAWTAKMKATKLDDAKTALTNNAWISANATAYITKDGITKNVWSDDQKYSVVNAEGNDITIEAASLKWTGSSTAAAEQIYNLGISKPLAASTALYLYRTYKDGSSKYYNAVKVDYDDKIVNVTPVTTDPALSNAPTGYTFAKIAFTKDAQALEFTGVYEENNTNYNVSFTLNLGPKPADKKNLDLGTFKVNGSYTKEVKADLSGILKAFIGDDADLYANIEIPTGTPTYVNFDDYFAETLTGQAQKVIKETAETSTDISSKINATDYAFAFEVPDLGNDKGKDKSKFALPKPTVSGDTYVVTFEFSAFDVTYAGSMKVQIADDANFALTTTPYVQDGKIKVTYNNATPTNASEPWNGPIKLNQVNFADYLALTKAPENEDPATLGLKVKITLTADQYKNASNTNTNYTGTLPNTSITLDVKTTTDGKYTAKLESNPNAILDWKDFTGRTIAATAELYKEYGSSTETLVGDAVKLTLEAVDPFRSFATKDLEIKYEPGQKVYINLADLVKLTSNVDGSALTEFGNKAIAATENDPAIPFTFSFKSHGLKMNNFGYINDKGKFVNFGSTIDVLVNGGSVPLKIETTPVPKDGKSYDYMITLQTNSALTDGCQIKFRLGLHTTNICQSGDDQVAEHSGDVTITLVAK